MPLPARFANCLSVASSDVFFRAPSQLHQAFYYRLEVEIARHEYRAIKILTEPVIQHVNCQKNVNLLLLPSRTSPAGPGVSGKRAEPYVPVRDAGNLFNLCFLISHPHFIVALRLAVPLKVVKAVVKKRLLAPEVQLIEYDPVIISKVRAEPFFEAKTQVTAVDKGV